MAFMLLCSLAMKPVVLRPDNFTPPTRTPWGGRKILDRYKASLGLILEHQVVGESWEVSVEPSFPSRLVETDETLRQVIERAPEQWLGPATSDRHGGQTPLLIKLLDSADNLSVQVHPAEDDPDLAVGESGKLESWWVLDAEPGGGLFLGFREGVQEKDVRQCLEHEGALDQLLNFVPVAPGDTFVIQAGTVHAIGRGVTLVEPQYVQPGKRGLTYRFWDWNRRYDGEGNLDPSGKPRELHVDRSLQVTTWEQPRGQAFVDGCRVNPETLTPGDLGRHLLVDWPWFIVELWEGTGRLPVPSVGTMTALTCVGGSAEVSAGDGTIALRSGLSAVVPAAAGPIEMTGRDVRIIATRSAD